MGQLDAEGGLNKHMSEGNRPMGCSLPCNQLYMRFEEENQDVFCWLIFSSPEGLGLQSPNVVGD